MKQITTELERQALELQRGETGHLPEVPRTPDGQFGTLARRQGRALAQAILFDPKIEENLKLEPDSYLANLIVRLKAGEAGQMELLIWRYALGEPQKSSDDEERRQAQVRDRARERLRGVLVDEPARARVLDAKVMGATRLLPMPGTPRRPHRHQKDDDEEAT